VVNNRIEDWQVFNLSHPSIYPEAKSKCYCVACYKKYLRSHNDFKATVKDIRKQFKFVGEMGSYYFLYVIGEEVPPHEEVMKPSK